MAAPAALETRGASSIVFAELEIAGRLSIDRLFSRGAARANRYTYKCCCPLARAAVFYCVAVAVIHFHFAAPAESELHLPSYSAGRRAQFMGDEIRREGLATRLRDRTSRD